MTFFWRSDVEYSAGQVLFFKKQPIVIVLGYDVDNKAYLCQTNSHALMKLIKNLKEVE